MKVTFHFVKLRIRALRISRVNSHRNFALLNTATHISSMMFRKTHIEINDTRKYDDTATDATSLFMLSSLSI